MPLNHEMSLMDQARSQTSFNVQSLTNIIYDSEVQVEARRAAWARVEKVLGTDDTSKLPEQYANTSRENLYLEGLKMGKAAWDDGIKHDHNFFANYTPRYALGNSSPFGLTYIMFVKTIELMATPAQKARWLPLIQQGRINGAYVQTELSHGTAVAALQTTATFNILTDEFILHTPNLKAIKYWPGTLGFSATHAIVMARLIIPEKGVDSDAKMVDYGVHPFFVQLRDLETGKPMPGIELGDVGLKPAHNQNDNGYAVFDHVAIPRTDLLMAEATVNRDGEYTKAKHAKAAYGTMIYTRSIIIEVCALQLAQATAIAVRYSTVRQQGRLPFDDQLLADGFPKEVPIIQYKSQHYRLLTNIAKAYAILFAYKHCRTVQADLEMRLAAKDHSTLANTHSLMACMKAWSSEIAAVSAEDARKCCGGQGYLNISGLPEIVQSLTSICTLEGDNAVMYQQTARYLMKVLPVLKDLDGYISTDLAYLILPDVGKCTASGEDFLDPDIQLTIYRHRARRLVSKSFIKITQGVAKGSTKSAAWNENMMLLISTARAHAELLVLDQFITAVSAITDPLIHRTLSALRSLFALSQITNPTSIDAITFLDDNYLTSKQLDDVRDLINHHLTHLLPEAIGLTDAWDFSDASLASAIGMKDGNVYERLMGWTRQLPINIKAHEDGGVHRESWEGYVKPALKAKW